MTTEGTFRFFPTDYPAASKPWTKVDGDVTSYEREVHQLPVKNIRDHEDEFSSIDTAGFAVYTAPTKVKPEAFFDKDDSVVRSQYYDEVEQIIRSKQQGVKKVVIFDHTVRRRDPSSARQPVAQVHVDQTPGAAYARVRRHLPEQEAEALLKNGRIQLVNVWRPIQHAASDHPLAVVDWRTMQHEDLTAVDLLYPKRQDPQELDDRGKEQLPDPSSKESTEGYEARGETYSVKHSGKQQFWYYKDMEPEKCMFIKCFDNYSQNLKGTKGVSDLTPHTAFQDPKTPADAPFRQSIEVRCLIFYDN